MSWQHEIAFSSYYGYPNYWGSSGYWGGGIGPNSTLPDEGGFGSPRAIRLESENAYAMTDIERGKHEGGDPHLRSCREMMKYHIHATDGDIGHVDGMLVEEQNWAIRYLIVNTSKWWLGNQFLAAPQWIDHVRWSDAKVFLKMTRYAIQWAPAYDPIRQVERIKEQELHQHYGQRGYWAADT